jgi:hypothetical protein
MDPIEDNGIVCELDYVCGVKCVKEVVADDESAQKEIDRGLTSHQNEERRRTEYLNVIAQGIEENNVSIFTNPFKALGEWGGWVIPAAVVGGIAVVGGAVALRGRKKGGGKPGPDPDDGQQKKGQSTFRMQLYKEFGDTLYVGGGAQTVGARIEEVPSQGPPIARDDLTARISFGASENLSAQAIGMRGRYQCVNVEATGAGSSTAIVAVTFTGGGGTFTNNVRFNVESLVIEFPDAPLTFVAGSGKTYSLPFKISDGRTNFGWNPVFDVKFVSPNGNEHFCGVHVINDPDYPDKLFAIEMTECGKADDEVPGQMLNYVGNLTVTMPGEAGGAPQTLQGQFNVFRFYEGLRFTVEPLKCYSVPLVEQKEALGYAEEAFDMAGRAQASAMGMAGGIHGIAIAPATQVGMHEAARSAKELFPELFEEDQVFVLGKYDDVKITPGRTHAYLTLYVVDERTAKDGTRYQGIRTPLPEKEKMQLIFEDVPGSSVLLDKDGNEVARPVEQLDFRYFISRVDHVDNTVIFEMLPTKGVLMPPNRAKVRITATVEWNGRTFVASEEVLAISQPYRIDFEERHDEYVAADDEILKHLRAIQSKILNQDRYRGGIAKHGEVTLKGTLVDMAGGEIDHPVLALNPLTAPGLALYNLYTSIRNQRAADVYYEDLMPLYNYIESLIRGHEYEFGFCRPLYEKAVKVFARFENGELGSGQALDLALMGADAVLADTFAMTVRDLNHSWTALFIRVGAAIATYGASEKVMIPLASLAAGLEGSVNYIDKGGDSLFEAYRVGVDAFCKQALIECAFDKGMPYVMDAIKGSVTIGKEIVAQRGLIYKATGEMLDMAFSTSKYAKNLPAAARAVELTISKGAAKTSAFVTEYWGKLMSTNLGKFGGAVYDEVAGGVSKAAGAVKAWWTAGKSSIKEALGLVPPPPAGLVNPSRQAAYRFGRAQGMEKVEALRKLVNAGPHEYKLFEKRYIVLAVQSDKHAMRVLTELEGPGAKEVKALFNEMMGEIEEKALHMAKVQIHARKGIPMDRIQVKKFSGNSAAAVKAGEKVPKDMDAMFEYLDDVEGWVEVDHAFGQECFDQEFYKVCRGYSAESGAVAKQYAIEADMVITNRFHPESYGLDPEDVKRVVDEARANEAFTNPDQVGRAAEYKCAHWIKRAESAWAEGDLLAKAGKDWPAAVSYAKGEAFVEEGVYQLTKQSDRLIARKLAAMRAEGIAVQSSVNVEEFLEIVSMMKQCGMGKYGGRGLATAELETLLMEKYHKTILQVAGDLDTLVQDLSGAIEVAHALNPPKTVFDVAGEAVISGALRHTDYEEQ